MMGPRATVDFDPHGAAYAADWQGILRRMQDDTPVAWTEAHGGFWVLTRHADVMMAEKDWETFSCDNDINNERRGGRGVATPPGLFRFPLSESDPPYHTQLRRIEWPFFTPKGIERWAELPQRLIDAHIDAVIERGAADLCADIALPVSARTTMRIVGIPDEDWESYALPAHKLGYTPSDSPEYPADEIADVQRRLYHLVAARRMAPRGDIVSAIVAGSVDDKPIDDDIAVGLLSALVFGGFDTAASLVLNALDWLEDKPEHHQGLIDDPKFMTTAVEEFLRCFPSAHGAGRSVMKEIALRGQRLMPGDRVYLSYPAANRDPALFDNPDEVRLDRSNAARHLSFGTAVHSCLGATLARREAAVMIRTVLQRMPDYRIDRTRAKRYPRSGRVYGWLGMPVTFAPGNRSAPAGTAVSLEPA